MAEPTKLTLDAALDIEGSEDTTQLEVRGHSQQTAPLQEWQDNGGDTLACVSGDGRLLVGDVDLELPAAMVEVSQDVALPSSLPPRGLSVLGRLSGAAAGAITWVAHELQLVGSGGVSGLHSALRAALMLENSGDAGLAELRAGDFEAANRAGSSQTPVGKMTGLRSAVVGEAGSYLDEAVALEASVQQETGGVINTAYGLKVEDVPAAGEGSYAIHTGQGAVHLGDYLELAELSAPGTPGVGLVRVYPKADGHLYAKDDQGAEYDLTTGGGGGSAIAVKEDGAAVVAAADTFDFKDFNVEDLGSGDAAIYHNLPGIFNARLTLETGVPVSTTSQTAKTAVYLTPYRGNKISLYDGTRWKLHSLTEIDIALTDVQTGDTTNTSAVITDLTDTSQLIAGMEVTGVGIPASTTIASIDSATQVTLDQAATADGADVELTFKVPADTVLDVFVFPDSGTPKLEMVAWADGSTRATAITTQDSIYAKTGDTTRRLVGTVCATATAGQTEVSSSFCGISNIVNRVLFRMFCVESTNTWTYSTATWRATNNDTTLGVNRIGFIDALGDVFVRATNVAMAAHSTGFQRGSGGVGINSTSTNSAYLHGQIFNQLNRLFARGIYAGYVGAGYTFIQRLEIASGVNTTTWVGDAGYPELKTGMEVIIEY